MIFNSADNGSGVITASVVLNAAGQLHPSTRMKGEGLWCIKGWIIVFLLMSDLLQIWAWVFVDGCFN